MQTKNLGLKAKALYDERRWRAGYFPASIFGEPAWDILLHLYVARSEGVATTVRAACFAADVPEASAFQALDHLQALGMTRRTCSFGTTPQETVELEDGAFDQLTSLLEALP
jgi:hypothetical protein